MKVVDIYFMINDEDIEDELYRQEREERKKKNRYQARLENENSAKMKAMKEYLFGEHVTEVPMMSLERFHDVPLPSSSSQPFRENRDLTLAVSGCRVYQYFV